MNIDTPAGEKQTDTRDSQRWEAVVARDSGSSPAFVYAVLTTGIFCRPGCPARRPLRQNVRFFDVPAAAVDAGFRPCKRCAPGQVVTIQHAHQAAIVNACKQIENNEVVPPLAALANTAGLSSSHFHRLFKQTLGITPKQYASSVQRSRLQAGLRKHGSVTEAIHAAGFGSESRVYEAPHKSLGMTPAAYRNGGAKQSIEFAIAPTVLGKMLVGTTAKGICSIEFGETESVLKRQLTDRFPAASLTQNTQGLCAEIEAVVAAIESPERALPLPLDIRGTAFQQQVWAALQDIPRGETASYKDIAVAIGKPNAHRAVAQACAANSIAIAIPCHRVVRSSGEPGGYRWGVKRKLALLKQEQGDKE